MEEIRTCKHYTVKCYCCNCQFQNIADEYGNTLDLVPEDNSPYYCVKCGERGGVL